MTSDSSVGAQKTWRMMVEVTVGSTKVERREGWKHSKQSEQAMIADVLKAY